MHRHFVPFNALGVLCAVGYAGYATTPSHIPWGGYAATVLFFIAAAGPIIREYRRLKIGFRDIESAYLENRRREHRPPEQEVIGPEAPTARFVQKRTALNVLLMLLSAVATLLLVSDFAYRLINLSDNPGTSDLITNF